VSAPAGHTGMGGSIRIDVLLLQIFEENDLFAVKSMHECDG
jgi:hypothetical protein